MNKSLYGWFVGILLLFTGFALLSLHGEVLFTAKIIRQFTTKIQSNMCKTTLQVHLPQNTLHIKLCVNKKSYRIARIIFPTFAYTNHPKILGFFACIRSTFTFVFSYLRKWKEKVFRRLLGVILWENNA